MSLMILNRLEDARLFWRRLPLPARSLERADAQAAWSLLQALWQRDYPAFWRGVTGFPWEGLSAVVAAALQEAIRARVVALVEQCYTTLDEARGGALFHLDRAALGQLATQRGWSSVTVRGRESLRKEIQTRATTYSLTLQNQFATYCCLGNMFIGLPCYCIPDLLGQWPKFLPVAQAFGAEGRAHLGGRPGEVRRVRGSARGLVEEPVELSRQEARGENEMRFDEMSVSDDLARAGSSSLTRSLPA